MDEWIFEEIYSQWLNENKLDFSLDPIFYYSSLKKVFIAYKEDPFPRNYDRSS